MHHTGKVYIMAHLLVFAYSSEVLFCTLAIGHKKILQFEWGHITSEWFTELQQKEPQVVGETIMWKLDQ